MDFTWEIHCERNWKFDNLRSERTEYFRIMFIFNTHKYNFVASVTQNNFDKI